MTAPGPAAAPAPPANPPAPPDLRPARFEDYPQIQALEAAHGMGVLSQDDWTGLWLHNPLWPRIADRWPIGWVLEAPGGRIVGSLANLPTLYRFRGRELTAANGRAWVVDPEYRGVALWLFAEYFAQEQIDLFVNTTVSALSVNSFGAFSELIPLGDWEAAAYWVTGHRGFARAALTMKDLPLAGPLALPAGAALWLADKLRSKSLPADPAGVDVAPATGFDDRFDAFWEELVALHPDRLLGLRDRRTLAWHFRIPLSLGRSWIFTASRGGRLRAYCVLKRQDARGGLNRMRLIDYQTVEPDTDLLPALLRAAIARCAAEGIHSLEHLGSGLPKMRAFDEYAPHRRRIPAWPYFCHAPDPALNAELRRPEIWDPSTYDGDASFE